MAEHVMQHPESPTWCIHCGTFDVYCEYEPCVSEQAGRYDCAKPGIKARMFREVFGIREEAAR